MKTHLRKRKLIIRLSAVLCLLVVIALLVLSFFASLYRTIPATIPFFSSLPRYKNAWMYTAPTRLRQPKPEVLSAAYISFIDSTRHHVSQLRWTMRNIEDVFNKAHDYPYIIFSTEPLTTEYKELIASVTKADVSFQVLGKEYYGYTNTTDQYTAYLTRQKLAYTLYGDSEPFRFKSRLMAGTLYKHASLKGLDYFWRFEPGSEFICPIQFDPFEYMKKNNKQLSFSLSTHELQENLPSLYSTVMKFKAEHPQWKPASDPPEKSLFSGMVDKQGRYNRCYFWNNFQIGKLDFFKSKEFTTFFDYLDKKNGIFYERWADPVIHSFAAALFLDKSQVHQWQDIGYRYHDYYTHCPSKRELWEKCTCRPEQNFDFDDASCLSSFDL